MLRIWKEKLLQGLKDDGIPWDWTSRSLSGRSRDTPIRARVVAKSPGVWAACGLASAVEAIAEEEWGVSVAVRNRAKDGEVLKPGTVVSEWRGPRDALFALERSYLNLSGFVSGIATHTHALVTRVRKCRVDPIPRVTLTRKTLPGYRDLSIHAVLCGGGSPHRVSLSGGVLIKENHIAAARGIKSAIEGARSVTPHGLMVEVEVRNLVELKQALKYGADGILLDNFSPQEIQSALRVILRMDSRPFIEVSGGINEKNIENYVYSGVDVISVGALTHSVQTLDLTLLVESR